MFVGLCGGERRGDGPAGGCWCEEGLVGESVGGWVCFVSSVMDNREDLMIDAPISPFKSAMGCCGRRAEAGVCVRLILRHLLASPRVCAREAPSCS